MTHSEPLTVQLEPDKRQAIDRIATETHRDRDDILNEAIAAYLEIYDWQISHIKDVIR